MNRLLAVGITIAFNDDQGGDGRRIHSSFELTIRKNRDGSMRLSVELNRAERRLTVAIANAQKYPTGQSV
jgi:hypothetical protein